METVGTIVSIERDPEARGIDRIARMRTMDSEHHDRTILENGAAGAGLNERDDGNGMTPGRIGPVLSHGQNAGNAGADRGRGQGDGQHQ